MKVIAYILAAIFIFFGVIFILGAFSPQGSPGWILTGIILVGIGFVIIWFASRKKAAVSDASQPIQLKIDLPGNVKWDTLKCQSCGGSLSPENVTMVAGAPVVNCPYCHTTYQLTEEPKW